MKYKIAFLTLLSIFGCKPNSEKKTMDLNNSNTLNNEVKQLIEKHGYNVVADNELLVPNFKEKVILDSKFSINEFPNGVTTQLDIFVKFPNGRKIIESFGDVGATQKEALENNLKNFITNDFHVIINALNNTIDDNITLEEWKINSQKYKAYIGNF